MKSMIVGMLAETPVHVGAGQSSGFVDQPVARESLTGYPMIPGSGLKGAFKEFARRKWPDAEENKISPEVKSIFGEQEGAGNLLISDARLLLLPIRSLTGHYKWVTCPYILERLRRDFDRSEIGLKIMLPENIASVEKSKILANNAGAEKKVFLEEREFTVKCGVDEEIITVIKNLMPHDAVRERLKNQLVVMHNDDFNWFALYGLSVNARNVLKKETKTSANLWYEETIPTDSLFYTILFERGAGAVDKIGGLLEESSFIQVGGNETVGHGWFSLKMIRQEG